jgi:hypothetical protein
MKIKKPYRNTAYTAIALVLFPMLFYSVVKTLHIFEGIPDQLYSDLIELFKRVILPLAFLLFMLCGISFMVTLSNEDEKERGLK